MILLPVAIWVQNNGIKIVHLTPELNRIKANHFGDKDRIAEETQKLYKREKYNAFANLIPTFVQLVLLIGLIQVIYHPLNHIFHADGSLIDAMVQLTGQLTRLRRGLQLRAAHRGAGHPDRPVHRCLPGTARHDCRT